MLILENIDIDKAILQNIDIDKISNRFKFGISNRANRGYLLQFFPAAQLLEIRQSSRIGATAHTTTAFQIEAKITPL